MREFASALPRLSSVWPRVRASVGPRAMVLEIQQHRSSDSGQIFHDLHSSDSGQILCECQLRRRHRQAMFRVMQQHHSSDSCQIFHDHHSSESGQISCDRRLRRRHRQGCGRRCRTRRDQQAHSSERPRECLVRRAASLGAEVLQKKEPSGEDVDVVVFFGCSRSTSFSAYAYALGVCVARAACFPLRH